MFACLFGGLMLIGSVTGGYRQPPFLLRHLTNAPASPAAKPLLKTTGKTLPARYDLRTPETGESLLPPVRNQLPYGTCWAFAALACIEYNMNKNGVPDADLSENNLVNLHGYDAGFDEGGNDLMATAVLLREEAPVAEALDPYPRPGKSVREQGVCIPRKVVFVPARSSVTDDAQRLRDLTVFKEALLAYGPLFASYGHYVQYFKTPAYYCPYATMPANHAIAIVGWDDAYPAAAFPVAPPGDGAFIVRNSWGPSSGEKGYLYISYYDATLGFSASVAYAALSDGTDYGRPYAYDRFGCVSATGYYTSSAAALNIFRARTNETLAAFGFYALSRNTSYTATFVRNPVFSKWGILSGDETVTAKTGVCSQAGYEVIPFDRTVSVAAGETFALVVELTAPETFLPIPISCNIQYADGGSFLSSVPAAAGKSYMAARRTGGWSDISGKGQYFCCKVYPAAPAAQATTTTATPIPFRWLDLYASGQTDPDYLMRYFYGSYNALALHVAPNGHTLEHAYTHGLDPDNAEETQLRATISLSADGTPTVGITPYNPVLWDYAVLGSKDLGAWHAREAGDRFFKVHVSPKSHVER